jgi:uncharacterized protein YydD (DUF2326 family)
LNTTALISLKQNAQGNVEFKANIQNPNGESITQDDNGASYKKLLCIAFDMALLENYSHESFYRFAFHDGALEALDNRKKIAFLNVSRNICQVHNLQHIITLIDTDAPTDENHQPIHFNKRETVLELNDKDEKGLLFEKKS